MTAATGPSPFGATNITAPAFDGFAVTPSNSLKFNIMCRGIYVGTTGDITVVMASGAVLLFKAVPAGQILPVVAQRVNSTGTTAQDMVGLV